HGRITAARTGPSPVCWDRSPRRASGSLISTGGRAHFPGDTGGPFGPGAIEQLYRRAWHDRTDGMLVDELGMPVATQKNGKIIKPGDDPLQLDTVHEENRHGCFVFSHMVQENILNVLRLLVGHGEHPSSCRSFIA